MRERGCACSGHRHTFGFSSVPSPPLPSPWDSGPDVFTPKSQWLFLETVWESLPRATVLKMLTVDPLGVPETLGRGLQGQNYFHSRSEMLFVFFTVILWLNSFSGIFQKLHDTRYHNRLNATVESRIHLSSIKSDIEEICKNLKTSHSSH